MTRISTLYYGEDNAARTAVVASNSLELTRPAEKFGLFFAPSGADYVSASIDDVIDGAKVKTLNLDFQRRLRNFWFVLLRSICHQKHLQTFENVENVYEIILTGKCSPHFFRCYLFHVSLFDNADNLQMLKKFFLAGVLQNTRVHHNNQYT